MAWRASGWEGELLGVNGRPMRSAEIHLIGGHGELVARTGENGAFVFPDVPPNDYELIVVSLGREVWHGKLLHLCASSPTVRTHSRIRIGTKLLLTSSKGQFQPNSATACLRRVGILRYLDHCLPQTECPIAVGRSMQS
jgi:tRNA/tmRNA/rRNA uracil-C5-methylase (TrmA/RlmC/RlmD family)